MKHALYLYTSKHFQIFPQPLDSCYYSIAITVDFFVSLSDTPYPRYAVFPLEKAITAQEVSLDTVFLRYPFRVTVRDSVALIMDLHNADYYYHAFTYPAWKHIVSFGKRGEIVNWIS